MIEIRDDRGRALAFTRAPERVVSLVPSDTLTLCDLGCASALVGRTDYCELPESITSRLPSVGGTKNPSVEKILDLRPDLVIANQEENTRSDLEALAQRGARVFVSFPNRVAAGFAHMAKLAKVFDVVRDPKVKDLFRAAYAAMREAQDALPGMTPVPTFCPIWMDPLMTVSGATFISDMLRLAGAKNVFFDRERRYPRVSLSEIVLRAPELVLLPDEPHPFTESDADVFRAQDTPAARRGTVVRTCGKDLCWYGSRSVTALLRVRALVARFRGATA